MDKLTLDKGNMDYRKIAEKFLSNYKRSPYFLELFLREERNKDFKTVIDRFWRKDFIPDTEDELFLDLLIRELTIKDTKLGKVLNDEIDND